MSNQNWEVRQGRKISADGSWATAFVAHILDHSGQPLRTRWFTHRHEAERWAQANYPIVVAAESGAQQAPPSSDAPPATSVAPLPTEQIQLILDRGGLCSQADVKAMAIELLALRSVQRSGQRPDQRSHPSQIA